ncbi:MAG: hypothetical protein NT027_01935 [Proteobacteria bacterium]|nr:hypothetical protein [Pseudomonadota bacterium]
MINRTSILDSQLAGHPGRVLWPLYISILRTHQQFKGKPGNQCSINVFVGKPVDPNVSNSSAEPEDVQCLDLDGNFVYAPWEVSILEDKSKVAWASRPDVLKDKFLVLQGNEVKKLVEAGCTVLQQDSISLNFETFKWGGCFSMEGDAKFRKYLLEKYSPEQMAALIKSEGSQETIENFSIKNLFVSKGAKKVSLDKDGKRNLSKWIEAQSVTNRENLLAQYRHFSNLMTLEYLQKMKSVARTITGRYVPLSGNVAFYNENYPLYHVLDFIMTEWVSTRKTPSGFVEMVQFSERMGKQLIGTPASSDVELHRSSYASAYAMGIHMILPFDVYVGTTTPFEVKISEFKDLPDFVRDNKMALDDTFGLETYGYAAEPVSNAVMITKSIGGQNTEVVSVSHARFAEFKSIAKGAEVVINGQKYMTIAASTVGGLFFAASHWNELKQYSEKRLAIEEINSGSSRYSLRKSLGASEMPSDVAPRVSSVDFGHSKAGFTTVRLSNTDLKSFPIGTKIQFSQTRLVKELAASTNVGNLYFKGDFIGDMFPGQAIASIQLPSGTIMNFETSSKDSTTVEVPQSELDLLVSVRRKDRKISKDVFVHLVNWSSGLRSPKVKVDFNKVFGFSYSSKTVCNFRQAGSAGVKSIVPRPMAQADIKGYVDPTLDGRFIFDISNLKTWGILSCR